MRVLGGEKNSVISVSSVIQIDYEERETPSLPVRSI